MQIVPAIDLIDGRVVRLKQGNFEDVTLYSSTAEELAKQFADAGCTRLHVVDLDGARQGSPSDKNLDVMKSISQQTNLDIDFSGGIRTQADADRIISGGAAYIGIGSLSVLDMEATEEIANSIGFERIIFAADCEKDQVYIKGWQEGGSVSLFDHIALWTSKGAKRFMITDIDRDGMLEGPSIDLYKEILNSFSGMKLIASGGVSSIDDLRILQLAGVDEIIIGKAILEGQITLTSLAEQKFIS